MARGKVITTHLRTGDPNGIRTVFISNKICEMIVFPKSEFDMVSQLEESARPALYILLGEDENGAAQAYIGETTNGVKPINSTRVLQILQNDYTTLKITPGAKINVGRAMKELGVETCNYSNVAHYRVVPMKAV